MLELDEGKLSRPVLRRGSGRNPASLSRRRASALRAPSRRGRCLTGVDSSSNGLSKFVAIDEESNPEIMPVLRLGEAQRTADEPLDPGPQIAGLALHVLGVLLAHLRRLSSAMPLVGPPAVRGELCDATGGQQLLEVQQDVVLP